MNTINGKVIDLKTKTGQSASGEWTSTTVVVQTSSGRNNTVPIDFFNKEANCNVGDVVSIQFYPAGREYQGKYYAQLDGASIEVTNAAQPSTKQSPQQTIKHVPLPNEVDGDLPF